MNASDYRREYSAYRSALARELYRRHAGLSDDPRRLARLGERYSHLWRREEVEDLRGALAGTPAEFATERAGLRNLVGAAGLGYVEARAAELREELARCEAARVTPDGSQPPAPIDSDDTLHLLALEADATRRRELFARRLDALRPYDDLRIALLESRRDSARELGFDDYPSLLEEVGGFDSETHAAAADKLLRATSTAYRGQLARWAARELPPALARDPHHADSFYFRRLAHLEPFFDARDLRTVYVAALNGFGARAEGQSNVFIDDAARPAKGARTRCFGATPPGEVVLSVGARESGALLFRSFFEQAGRAQFYAWASRDMSARYPEFVHAPDSSVRDGYGVLLRRLFADAEWVGERRGLRGSEAREVARSCALVEMYEARRCAALLRHAHALGDSPGTGQTAEEYAALHTDATGFRHEPAASLLDAEAAFRANERWRATLLAAALEEHLRARHGRRWWASRRAGDELIDMWNAAARYPVEELARLVGAGELSVELLAAGLNAAAAGEGA